jgi:hypothetical protein
VGTPPKQPDTPVNSAVIRRTNMTGRDIATTRRTDRRGHDVARVISLSLCPGLLAMTFLTMELALGANLEALNVESSFIPSFRRFINTSLFTPFFLGVLVGHWYHPVPRWFTFLDERIYRQKQGIPIAIVLTSTTFLLVLGIVIYVLEWSVPSPVNTGMVIVGILFGAVVWPVHALHDVPHGNPGTTT